MRKGIDLSGATRTERLVLAIGLAMFVNALLPWWYRVRTLRQTFLHNGGLYGWGIVAALAGFTAAAIVVARHSKAPAAFGDRNWHFMLGSIAVVGLVVSAATSPTGVWIGFWIEVALAVALVTTGVARLRERGRGWV